jgi:hypothetical protein
MHKYGINFSLLELPTMNKQLSQSNQLSPIFMRVGLISVLLLTGIGVFFSVRWIYHGVQYSLGLEMAEVVMAFLVIIIFGLILIGFGAGFGAKRVLRKRKAQALKIYHSMRWCKIFQASWEYIGPPSESEHVVSTQKQDVPEITLLPDRAPKRGRIPMYSMDRWIKVVSAWESRDTWRNPITLDEFLSEEFGTNADGSPKISKKPYYDWQKKVHEEARKGEAEKKNLSPN